MKALATVFLLIWANGFAMPVLAQEGVLPAGHKAIPSAITIPVEQSSVKVCVSEPKNTTKTVYNSHCKDYCIPTRSIWSVLSRCCDLFPHDDCDSCGEVHSKRVLVKKIVPGPTKTECSPRVHKQMFPAALDPRILQATKVLSQQQGGTGHNSSP